MLHAGKQRHEQKMQEIMTSVESLTCQEKTVTMHLSGCGLQLVSKRGLLTRTPAFHLLATHSGESSLCFTLSSSSSSSSSIQDQTSNHPKRERDVENLSPRRPLKLAPLQLPTEVRERQKVKPDDPCPIKPKVCWSDMPDKSPERDPLSIITEPYKPQQRVTAALLLPVNQLKIGSDWSTSDKEPVKGNPSINANSHPLFLCQNRQTQICPARAPENSCQPERFASQSPVPSKNLDAVKRRLRLRRTNRLEEDQSKSSSSAGGLSADEGTTTPAGPGKGQRSAEKTLRDAGHRLEKTSWRNLREPEAFETEAVGNVGC